MKKDWKTSAWKGPYGHLKRSFDKPADFFFLRFRSFLAQNPRTIKRWGSFQREFYSSVRRFRRTRGKTVLTKVTNFFEQNLQFFIFPQIFLKYISLEKKYSLECPSGHLVCMFHNLPQFFCPELQKQKFAQSHKTFWKLKNPLNTKKIAMKSSSKHVACSFCEPVDYLGQKFVIVPAKLWQFKKRET